MADTMYRRPLTLEDVLLGANAGTEAPVAPAQPSSNQDYGILSQGQRQSVLESLLAPTDLGPEPDVDKRNVGSEIFNALGDALGAYSAGVTGGPRTDYTGRYFGRRELQKQEREQFRKQAALVKTNDTRRKGEILLGEDTNLRERQLADSVRKASIEAAQKQKQEDKDAVLAAATLRRHQELADRQAAQDREDVKTKRAQIHDVAMAKLHSKLRTDDDTDKVMAREQIKAVGEAKGYINEVAANVAGFSETAGGPDKVRAFIRRKVEAIPFMEPDALEAVMAYYDKEVQDQYDEMSGGPMVPGGGF